MVFGWYLEGAPVNGNRLMIPVDHVPMSIGRNSTCDVTIASESVSRVHALIELAEQDGLHLADQGSTNGTFVNRRRIPGPTVVSDGDVLHFGTAEFRVGRRELNISSQGPGWEATAMFSHSTMALPEHFEHRQRDFSAMLANKSVRVAWQPIVETRGGRTVAYEVLGRGASPTLPESPGWLFSIAERLGKEVELSQLFRRIGAQVAATRGPTKLFMNTHPNEPLDESFFESIDEVQTIAPELELVLEVNEFALELSEIKKMAARLRTMGVGFAYDDFGAGLSRLKEIAEIPADVVKFDMGLIRDIDRAGAKKQQMLARLVRMVADMGSTTLAEGVETMAEAQCCLEMGFELLQGYLTGRPEIVES